MNVSEDIDNFSEFESKVNQVMKLLEEINASNKTQDETDVQQTDTLAGANCEQNAHKDSFIVSVKESSRNSINRAAHKTDVEKLPVEMDKYTFMRQLEQDADKRFEVRKEREHMAQNFRTLGNEAFRNENFEKAVVMYTKAIDQIKDSPILYNNRALAYIKLKAYKRAIMDCDHVLNKLEEKNLRSWLYRGIAYQRAGDEKNFEISINLAKKNNPRKHQFIESFLSQTMSSET